MREINKKIRNRREEKAIDRRQRRISIGKRRRG
jgi:hypothetical protein